MAMRNYVTTSLAILVKRIFIKSPLDGATSDVLRLSSTAMYLQEKMMLGSLSDDDSESNLSASMPPDGASGSIHLSQNFGEDREAEMRVQAMLVGGTTEQVRHFVCNRNVTFPVSLMVDLRYIC